MSHLVEALRCKVEGRGFDFRRGYWDVSSSPGPTKLLTEKSNGGWCVGLTIFPLSCADCLDILGALTIIFNKTFLNLKK